MLVITLLHIHNEVFILKFWPQIHIIVHISLSILIATCMVSKLIIIVHVSIQAANSARSSLDEDIFSCQSFTSFEMDSYILYNSLI